MNRERLLLVDGMNLLFQMFFGMPARIVNSQGRAVQGILGFTGALKKTIAMVRPTRILAVFDGEHGNPRTSISADYKANRPDLSEVPDDENPFSQIDDIYRVLSFMKIPCYETRVYEADDVIASYADALKAGMEIVICSHDSDFFQLIGPGVSVIRYRGEKSVLCDEAWLMEKYGITGSMYADFKCLTGDSADNIRGLDGVGPKTASVLINRFGSLDGLVSGYASIERERLRGIVAAGLETLALNRSLIYMKRDIELPVAAQELGFEDNGMGTMDILKALGIMP